MRAAVDAVLETIARLDAALAAWQGATLSPDTASAPGEPTSRPHGPVRSVTCPECQRTFAARASGVPQVYCGAGCRDTASARRRRERSNGGSPDTTVLPNRPERLMKAPYADEDPRVSAALRLPEL
jgi:hypothetical protein